MKACNACGRCCQIYGGGRLAASEGDIQWWTAVRPAVADYVRHGQIWISPQTGEQLTDCPWLEPPKESPVELGAGYTCAIYQDRPEECRQYPSGLDEMYRDGCEMLETQDLKTPAKALERLAVLHL